jgi:hypothetical protein
MGSLVRKMAPVAAVDQRTIHNSVFLQIWEQGQDQQRKMHDRRTAAVLLCGRKRLVETRGIPAERRKAEWVAAD